MNVEELIDKIYRIEFDDYEKAKAEILSRFAELEQYKTAFEPLWDYCVEERKNKIALELKIAELEKGTSILNSTIASKDREIERLEKEIENLKTDGWVKRVYQLEHQLEDMKCCGNCKYSDTDWNKKVVCCLVEEKETKAYKYCDNWQSDRMKRSER